MAAITLLTDFGTQDYFVGAMKGVILSRDPSAQIIDITHDIPPQDIESAAFNLLAYYRDFPSGTIHVAVVDPGVGSKRKAVAVECAHQFFVGPDNGMFSWVCERESEFRAFHVTKREYFKSPVSETFHGRDVFAPIAAALSKGTRISDLGTLLRDICRLASLKPTTAADGSIDGRIIHIDHFGNCVTNLTHEHVQAELFDGGGKLRNNEYEISSFRHYFADETPTNEPFCYFGSAGFLEIAIRNSSAQAVLKLSRGNRVRFERGDR